MGSYQRSLSIFLFILTASCSSQDVKSQEDGVYKFPDSIDVSEYSERASQVKNRLQNEFLENGWLVTRNEDGTPRHINDSGKYTGIFLGIAPCHEAYSSESGLRKSIGANNGQFMRYDPPARSEKRGWTSRDIEVGTTFGLVMRSIRCGTSFKGVWQKHWDFVKNNNWYLEPPDDDKLTPGYLHVFGKVHQKLTGSNPDEPPKWIWEAGLLAAAEGVESSGEPCYPVDLVFDQLCFMSKMGYNVSKFTASKICAATKNMGLAHMDWYCKRGGREPSFLKSFQPNTYEYKLQQCHYQNSKEPAGVRTSGLDFLFMYHVYGGICNA